MVEQSQKLKHNGSKLDMKKERQNDHFENFLKVGKEIIQIHTLINVTFDLCKIISTGITDTSPISYLQLKIL